MYRYNTVVGDFINTMKTTFDFNFVDLYQAYKALIQKTWKQRGAVN